MAHQTMTITRTTCERCGEIEEQPGNTNRLPAGWAAVGVTVQGEDANKQKTFDLCPRCRDRIKHALLPDPEPST